MLVKLNDCDFCEHKVPTQLAQWHLEKKHPHRLEKVTSDDLTNDEVSPIRQDFEETQSQESIEKIDLTLNDHEDEIDEIDRTNTFRPGTFNIFHYIIIYNF